MCGNTYTLLQVFSYNRLFEGHIIIMCGNAYTVLQVFSYNRLFEGHIICVVMLILYFKYSVTTDYLRDILYVW